jgi:prepilin-type N-terminal cleavage/methylation domain-containing protein
MRLLARIRGRLRQERGFTLVELLVAAAVGVVIITVAFGLLDSVVRAFGSSGERVDVSQRGRTAMDRITAKLRSQVCGGDPVAGYTPAIVSGTANQVVFWSDIGNGQAKRLRGVQYSNNQINELNYPGTGTDPSQTPTPNVVVTSVTPNNPPGSGLFHYYAYNPQAADQTITPAPALFTELPTPLASADLARVVRITVGFTAYPKGSGPTDKLAANFSGDFLSRTASSPYEFSAPPTDPSVVQPRCK